MHVPMRLLPLMSALALGASGQAVADEQPKFGSVGDVRAFMSAYLADAPLEERPPTLKIAFADLNADRLPEALVYVNGPYWCGTGGCNFYILKNTGRSYRIVARLPTTQLPVGVMRRRTNGWRDVSFMERFDATKREEQVLQFDGWKYPSLVPHRARKTFRDQAREVVLTYESPSLELSPKR